MNQRIVYLNGRFIAEHEATVPIFDRGLLFADSIYEVVGVMDGMLTDFHHHMERRERSMTELSMTSCLGNDDILTICRDLVARNGVRDGMIYMQFTRGTAERDFVYDSALKSTVFMFTQQWPASETDAASAGVKLKSVPDLRWARRDIKSTGLLAQVFAKQAAHDAGCFEALMIKDGFVTEGGASSFYIIKDDRIITHPKTQDILPGVTRRAVLALAEEHGLAVEERKFTLTDAYGADGAFITGASTIFPVVQIDEKTIGDGTPAPLLRRLQELYLDYARRGAL